jgi:hypothetical protein
MDRVRCIEKDYRLLGGGGFGATILGSIFRCTTYRCPDCRWIFKITWGPFNSLLAAGERTCRHCKPVFWDGSNEWPEMASHHRYSFPVPITIAEYLALVLVTAGLPIFNFWYFNPHANRVDPTVAIALVMLLPVWFAFRSVQVIRSIRRYNDRGKTMLS